MFSHFRSIVLVAVVAFTAISVVGCARNQMGLLAEPSYLNYPREEILAAGGWKATKEGLTKAITGKRVVYRKCEDRRHNKYTWIDFFADGSQNRRTCTIRGNSCKMMSKSYWTVGPTGDFVRRKDGKHLLDVYFVDSQTYVVFSPGQNGYGCCFGSKPHSQVCNEYHIVGPVQSEPKP